ncbi:hypothetical protein [Halobellus clavatus]|uniref:hypothetical protein n=1 Tax=Halobellus clavatus TaxID=660517 RepID=UPI001113BC8A|nr:hypothetical protein [Halobellus clavatus]
MVFPEWLEDKATKRDLLIAVVTVTLTLLGQFAYAEYQQSQDNPINIVTNDQYRVPANTSWPLPIVAINQRDHKVVIDDLQLYGWHVNSSRKQDEEPKDTELEVENLDRYIEQQERELRRRTLNASGVIGDRDSYSPIVYTPSQPGNYTGYFKISTESGKELKKSFQLEAVNISSQE